VDGLDVIGIGHRAVDEDRDRHEIAVLGRLGQIDGNPAFDRRRLSDDLGKSLLEVFCPLRFAR